MKYIITGKNKLTGLRDQLSRAMDKEEAEQRLNREKESRRYQRYQPYTHLKLERYEAVQLTIVFED